MSIPPAWPQFLDFFGIPLVVEPAGKEGGRSRFRACQEGWCQERFGEGAENNS
jgi:hypothetical protein